MMSEVSASLTETINGIKVVKSFGKERFENRSFVEKLRPVFDVNMTVCMNSVYLWMIAEAINIICIVIVLGVGGSMVIRHQMNTQLTSPIASFQVILSKS